MKVEDAVIHLYRIKRAMPPGTGPHLITWLRIFVSFLEIRHPNSNHMTSTQVYQEKSLCRRKFN